MEVIVIRIAIVFIFILILSIGCSQNVDTQVDEDLSEEILNLKSEVENIYKGNFTLTCNSGLSNFICNS